MNDTLEILEAEAATKPVNMEVVKLNVTDSRIAELKAEYLPLVINGIDDKIGLKRCMTAAK